MSARDRKRHEYALRLDADAAKAEAQDDESSAAGDRHAQRLEQQAVWVDLQIRQAMRRGEFDDLPGAGKPIPGIDAPHDPDWWLKSLIGRERITAVLPPALALPTEDARLDDELDRVPTPQGVRDVVDDFNARVVEARRQLLGGPAVITPLRDTDNEVEAWKCRRIERIARHEAERERIRREEGARAPAPRWRRTLTRLGFGP